MKRVLWLAMAAGLTGCQSPEYREDHIYGDEDTVAVVYAKAETAAVLTADDAADDPALWYNSTNPDASLILGTDKNFGIGVYTLRGERIQNLAAGLPNNIDLRQGVRIGSFVGDLAAASNRAGDVASLYRVSSAGIIPVGEFKAELVEPYGSCMGLLNGRVVVFITYKTGETQAHLLSDIREGRVEQRLIGTIEFATQLEGCVHDDVTGLLYVGEEGRGVWVTQASLGSDNTFNFTPPTLIDEAGGNSGIAADVEGMGLYINGDAGYLVVSSQGNHSYAVYDRAPPHAFRGRFRVLINEATGIDGSQETDGLDISSRAFGTDYPHGLLVVQDGFNAPPGEFQNFKVVDWRDVEQALGLE